MHQLPTYECPQLAKASRLKIMSYDLAVMPQD